MTWLPILVVLYVLCIFAVAVLLYRYASKLFDDGASALVAAIFWPFVLIITLVLLGGQLVEAVERRLP